MHISQPLHEWLAASPGAALKPAAGAALHDAAAALAPRCAQAKGQEALVERLTKNVGTAIGLELRDTTQPLNATNTRPVKAGMTFNVAVGAWRGRAAVGLWLLQVGCRLHCSFDCLAACGWSSGMEGARFLLALCPSVTTLPATASPPHPSYPPCRRVGAAARRRR